MLISMEDILSNPSVIAIGSVLAVILVLFFIFYRWGKLDIRSRTAAHIFEPFILLLGMFLLSAWYTQGFNPLEEWTNGSNANKTAEAIFFGGLLLAIPSLPILLITRFIRNRLAVIVICATWILLLFWYVYQWKSVPVIQEIRSADTLGIFDNRIFLSVMIIPIRIYIWTFISILGGFYATRNQFTYGRLITGVLITGYISGLMMTPFSIWPRWWLAPICFAAFSVILVTLPIQRSNLESLFGIRLSTNRPASPLPSSPIAIFAGHLALLILAISIACSAFINYYESVQYGIVNKGAPAQWRSSADQNAFEALKVYFLNGEPFPNVTTARQPKDYSKGLELTDQISSNTRQRILSHLDRDEWKIYFHKLQDFSGSLYAASQCDYLAISNGKALSYLNLRETARAMAIESVIALDEGRTTDAMQNVETLIKIGGLMKDQPLLVTQMVGSAIRNIGIHLAWNIIATRPDDRELLQQLATTLDFLMPFARVGLNYTIMQTGEPGMLNAPVIPNIEIVVPAFNRAHKNTLASWMNFDLVRVAVALERYKLDTGKYPDSLGNLSPTYLLQIPKEPFQGREYTYIKQSNGWYQLENLAYQTHSIVTAKLAEPLFMPPMLAPDKSTTDTVSR